MRNVAIRLVLQQWCRTNCTFLLLVLPPQIDLAQPITESTLKLLLKSVPAQQDLEFLVGYFKLPSTVEDKSLLFFFFFFFFLTKRGHWSQSHSIAQPRTDRWHLPVSMTVLRKLPEKPPSYYFETDVIHNYASCLFVTLDSKIEEPRQIVQVQDRLM